MNKITQSLGLAAALMFAASTSFASPLGGSITISDNNYDNSGSVSGSGWNYGNHEDNETETQPNTVQAQDWDLEGMYLNNKNLTVVGGFDFKKGTVYGGYDYKTGDIFIDNTGDAKYGSTGSSPNADPLTGGVHSVGPSGTLQTNNVDGYDYVIHFNATGTPGTSGYNGVASYSVYKLNTSSLVNRVMDVSSSNPWTYVVNPNEAVAGYQNVSLVYGSLLPAVYNSMTTFGSTSTGLKGGSYSGDGNPGGTDNNHYYLTVDLSFLPANHIDTFHYTVECGNDDLMARAQVPDMAATAMMLGGALAALVGLRRKLGA